MSLPPNAALLSQLLQVVGGGIGDELDKYRANAATHSHCEVLLTLITLASILLYQRSVPGKHGRVNHLHGQLVPIGASGKRSPDRHSMLRVNSNAVLVRQNLK